MLSKPLTVPQYFLSGVVYLLCVMYDQRRVLAVGFGRAREAGKKSLQIRLWERASELLRHLAERRIQSQESTEPGSTYCVHVHSCR